MKLIILDRDGVINEDSDNYIKSPEEWIPVPGSLEAIAQLKKVGYTIAIATNQSGIARGYYDLETLHDMHDKMATLLLDLGASIDYIAFCPHLSDDGCDCRKPKPGMLHQIAKHFSADLDNATMIGDTLGDMRAAQAAGTKFALVRTGKGLRTLASGEFPEHLPVYDNLAAYVSALLTPPSTLHTEK
jgi:D-glycero-D-manno-heptose 1,7-bisphosphate phosphatase